jgi:hypothetical protein
MSDWVKQVCELPLSYRHGNHTIVGLLAPAAAHLGDRSRFLAAVTVWIQAHRHLIDEWRHYSEDKRSHGPYFSTRMGSRYDPLVVGLLQADGSRSDETHHTDDVAACVDFIYREASWVLHRRRVT